MSVTKVPGMMQLTRTFGPKAWAKATVMALSPAFAAAYGTMSPLGRIEPTLLTLMIDPPGARRHPRADERRQIHHAMRTVATVRKAGLHAAAEPRPTGSHAERRVYDALRTTLPPAGSERRTSKDCWRSGIPRHGNPPGRRAERAARRQPGRTSPSAGRGLARRAVLTLHDARDLAVDLVDSRLRARDEALALLPDLLVRVALAGVERAEVGDQTLGGLDLVREVARC